MALRCEHCGTKGRHISSECPWRGELAASTPEPVPSRRPEREIADAEAWAARIRTQMGWSAEWLEALRLERAREQLARSRTCLDGIFRDNVELLGISEGY